MKQSKIAIPEQLQTKDIGRFISLTRQVRKTSKSSSEQSAIAKRIEQLLKASAAKTEHWKQTLPNPIISEELPVAAKQKEIVELLQNNQVVIVAGETGCGKTTQLPKLCLQAGLGRRGLIGHTQPRRVAATSVAARIASEHEVELGQLVGYSVRFASRLSEQTRIKLMTDGILLSELERDPLLSEYEVLIIDEAHERSLNIDFLLGFVKQILDKRPELKLVITSATIDHQRFAAFFDAAPIVQISGRSYPVEIRYRPLQSPDSPDKTEVEEAVIGCIHEAIQEGPGDILVFASGEAEIKKLSREIHRAFREQVEVLPLYARLGMAAQQKVFAPAKKRKVVVATNVAETSLTVPGIVYVIDIGLARISRYNSRNKIQQLPVEKISKASAEQRAGRCGRVAPGICYRLYDEEDFLAREDFTVPEIQRSNLAAVLLRLKLLGVTDPQKFPLLQAPSPKAWRNAALQLAELRAIDASGRVTRLGKQMARIPCDPQLARLLVEDHHHALHEMLIIAAFMSGREIRERPLDAQQKADQCHQQFVVKGSDAMTVIRLWQRLAEERSQHSANGFRRWCQDNFINFLGWLEWRNLYAQLKQAVYEVGLTENKNPATPEQVHRSLIAGFVSHVLYQDRDGSYRGARGLKVWLHPSSVCFKNKAQWMLSLEMMQTTKLYARMNVPLLPEWIEEAAEGLLKERYYDPFWHKKRGQVCAYLDRTLFGLPVVNRRVVNYAAVEPELSRQLFIKEGLVAFAIKSKLPFLAHNFNLIKTLKQKQAAKRRADLLLSDDELADWYQQKLPESINSEKALIRWLKKDWENHNERLKLQESDISRESLEQDDDFPPSIVVRDYEVKLTYTFAPGEPQDGITAHIPAAMIRQFSESDFEWLVPGFLQQKVLAYLKVLAKPLRKKIIPLAEAAKTITQRILQKDYRQQRFLEALSFEVTRLAGEPVKEDDFGEPELPAHLRIKFKIVGQSHSAQSLSELQSLQESVQHCRPADTTGQINNRPIESWPEEGISLENISYHNKQTIRIFQALTHNGQSLELRQCRSLEEAVALHRLGVCQLLIRDFQTPLRQFYRRWPDKKGLDKYAVRCGGSEHLMDNLFCAVVLESIGAKPIESRSQFDHLKKLIESTWRQSLSEKLNLITDLLRQRESIHLKLSALGHSVYDTSKEDIEAQLTTLWQAPILPEVCNSPGLLKRIQNGILARIKRISENFPKEEQALQIWQPWQEWWRELLTAQPQLLIYQQGYELWQSLESFRVHLFSPAVKPPFAISAKKLQAQFEKVEKWLDS